MQDLPLILLIIAAAGCVGWFACMLFSPNPNGWKQQEAKRKAFLKHHKK